MASAGLARAEASSIVRRCGLKPITARTITSAGALKTELKPVCTQGYAVVDREKEEGLRCVGAAGRSHSGMPVAAKSISGPAFRMTLERVPEVGRALTKAASELSAELGYQAAPTELVRSAAG